MLYSSKGSLGCVQRLNIYVKPTRQISSWQKPLANKTEKWKTSWKWRLHSQRGKNNIYILKLVFLLRTEVILTSTEPNIFRMLFFIKNQTFVMLQASCTFGGTKKKSSPWNIDTAGQVIWPTKCTGGLQNHNFFGFWWKTASYKYLVPWMFKSPLTSVLKISEKYLVDTFLNKTWMFV